MFRADEPTRAVATAADSQGEEKLVGNVFFPCASPGLKRVTFNDFSSTIGKRTTAAGSSNSFGLPPTTEELWKLRAKDCGLWCKVCSFRTGNLIENYVSRAHTVWGLEVFHKESAGWWSTQSVPSPVGNFGLAWKVVKVSRGWSFHREPKDNKCFSSQISIFRLKKKGSEASHIHYFDINLKR